MDVRQRCPKRRQRGNQVGQMRGELEVESLGQREAAACQEAAVLTREREAEAVQRDVLRQPAGANEGGGLRMDTLGGGATKGDTRWRQHDEM